MYGLALSVIHTSLERKPDERGLRAGGGRGLERAPGCVGPSAVLVPSVVRPPVPWGARRGAGPDRLSAGAVPAPTYRVRAFRTVARVLTGLGTDEGGGRVAEAAAGLDRGRVVSSASSAAADR
ncbi:hypothetical protein GCM10027162_57430 [Streptomyces incanus]